MFREKLSANSRVERLRMADSWQYGRLAIRRLTSRAQTPEGIWVYWRCEGREDVSPIRDISLGGVFVQTQRIKPVGTKMHLHFLIQEGHLRADAEVRHIRSGSGVGAEIYSRERRRPSGWLRSCRDCEVCRGRRSSDPT